MVFRASALRIMKAFGIHAGVTGAFPRRWALIQHGLMDTSINVLAEV